MPAVVVKEFSVEETPETLVVSVPFPPAYCNAKNSDVLCKTKNKKGEKLTNREADDDPSFQGTDLYLRISCPPYFFELDLAHPVLPDDRNSLATVGGGFVKCNLQKVFWEEGEDGDLKLKYSAVGWAHLKTPSVVCPQSHSHSHSPLPPGSNKLAFGRLSNIQALLVRLS